MLGGQLNEASAEKKVTVRRTAEVEIATENTLPAKFEDDYNTEVTVAPTEYKFLNLTTGARGQVKAEEATLTAAVGDRIRIFWDEERDGTTGKEAVQIVISPNTFPGTYKVVGDTFIRSEATGKDSPFQFVINKAKVNSEVTLTMQADGDPSTFSLTLRVLRSGKEMMQLIKYE